MVRFQLLSSRLHPGCQEHGPLAHSRCVALWAHLCLTRVVSSLDHLHLSPDGGFESEVRHYLDHGLHNRVAVGIASLSVVHFPAFYVGGGLDPTAYGRGSSRPSPRRQMGP